jgi:ZIP family zinc transporter
MEAFSNLHPILQAFLATVFTWLLTALGAATVFAVRGIDRRFLDGMLGFAAGVMLAASFWSLLAPAIEMSVGRSLPAWLPATLGFLAGCLFLWGLDRLLPHLHLGFPIEQAEGVRTGWRRNVLLILAITLHNIPEGLAVGVAFGAVSSGLPSATFAGAVALALGIGIQNFPEGTAVSMPLRQEGMSLWRSFWYGQLPAVVEPMAAVLGAAAVTFATPILPYALSFAAGAMLFVVIEELIPESQLGHNTDIATLGAVLGFAVMMVLEVGLG